MAYKIERRTLSEIANAIKENYSVSSISVEAFPSAIKDVKNSFLDGRAKSLKYNGNDSKLSSIGQGAFAFAPLSDVNLPYVSIIGRSAFYSCSNLQNINIGASASSYRIYIYENAFEKATIKNFDFGGKPINIGKEAFKNASFLNDYVTIDGGSDVPQEGAFSFASFGSSGYGTVNANFRHLSASSVFYGANLAHFIVKPLSGKIGYYAFNYCSHLSDFHISGDTISRKISYIESYAFANCYNLINFSIDTDINGANLSARTKISTRAFAYCYSLKSIYLSTVNSTKKGEIYDNAFAYCSSLSTVTLTGFSIIGLSAFSACSNLEYASIKDAVLIGKSVFLNCPKLKNVNFSNDIYHIDSSAFCNCYSLFMDQINFNKMQSIGSWAFYAVGSFSPSRELQCSQLKSIGDYAFAFCSALNGISITNLNNISYVGSYAFSYCGNISYIYLNNVSNYFFDKISVFAYCWRLHNITIKNSVGGTVIPLNYTPTVMFKSTPFTGYNPYNMPSPKIYVDASLVDAYKSATNWSTLSNFITAIEE